MKYSFILSVMLFVYPFYGVVAKSQKETTIESASQFQNWCKNLSYQYFRQKHQQPFNWAASTIRELNDYHTTGSWKVNNQERYVFCQVRKGRKAKSTKIEIH